VLEPPLRLQLWVRTFRLFFVWVWLSVILLLASGYWMLFSVFGGFSSAGMHIQTMNVLGLTMVAIYLHVFFAPYRRLRYAVAIEDYPEGGRQLGRIRMLVGLNLLLGLSVVVIAAGGRYS